MFRITKRAKGLAKLVAVAARNTVQYRLCTDRQTYDTESRAWRDVPLAGWSGIRQFLCSVPRRQAMVVGAVLAGGRLLSFDHRPLGVGGGAEQRPAGGAPGDAGEHDFLFLFLGPVVGAGRADVRVDDAVSGHVAGDGDGAGILRGVWDVDAADFRRSVREQRVGYGIGPGDSVRSGGWAGSRRTASGAWR